MRWLQIISLPLFFTTLEMLAQPSDGILDKSHVYFGIITGGNASWLSSNSMPNNTPKIGFNAGLSILYPVSSRMFINSSIVFIKEMNSTKNELDPMLPDYYIEKLMKFSWIELPMTFNYSFINKEKIKVLGGAGLSVARLLNSEITVTTQTTLKSSATFPYNDRTNPWNIFPRLQMGMIIRLSENDFLIMTVFYQGSSNELYKPVPVNSIYAFSIVEEERRLNVIGFDLQYTTKLKR